LTFEEVGKRAIGNLKLAINKVNWFSTYRVHHRVATRFREGRVFLLGDAAHVHSPVGGQGMNTGIGDAINLAWKLAAVMNGEAAVSLLASYEPERIRFARRLVATTDRVFGFVSRRGPLARWVRTKVFPAVAPSAFRLRLVRRFLFRTVSQTGIEYRNSPLSAGAAGSVRGGDRLPWVPLGPGYDNFAPLSSLSWQVHVYGDAPPGLAAMCASLQLPLHRFDWRQDMRRAGFLPSAIYLIRPDGYVAYADARAEPEALRGYFTERAMERRRERGANPETASAATRQAAAQRRSDRRASPDDGRIRLRRIAVGPRSVPNR
jgi:hypothetical protein